MPGNAVGGCPEVAGGRISGGRENLHLSEPHSPLLPPGSKGLLPVLDPILNWCVVRHSTVITASDEVGI